jgi:hypothetical protein
MSFPFSFEEGKRRAGFPDSGVYSPGSGSVYSGAARTNNRCVPLPPHAPRSRYCPQQIHAHESTSRNRQILIRKSNTLPQPDSLRRQLTGAALGCRPYDEQHVGAQQAAGRIAPRVQKFPNGTEAAYGSMREGFGLTDPSRVPCHMQKNFARPQCRRGRRRIAGKKLAAVPRTHRPIGDCHMNRQAK